MAEAEYWRFTVARDCQKKNTSENHSECRMIHDTPIHSLLIAAASDPAAVFERATFPAPSAIPTGAV